MSNFHGSAEGGSIHLDGSILRARLIDGDGNPRDAELDLNNVLGNNDGRFEWGGQGFSGSAESYSFNLEGDNVPVLRARLVNGGGEAQDADVNLAERIGNNGGEFYFE